MLFEGGLDIINYLVWLSYYVGFQFDRLKFIIKIKFKENKICCIERDVIFFREVCVRGREIICIVLLWNIIDLKLFMLFVLIFSYLLIQYVG